MSKEQNKNYDSDKENITPYRSTHSIMTSYIEDKDASVLEVSDYVPNTHNSTTTALNRILKRVNVNDISQLNRSDDLMSEVSFDMVSEPPTPCPGPDDEDKQPMILFDSTNETDKEDIETEKRDIETDKQDKVPSPDKELTTQNFEAKTPNIRRNPFEISSIDHFPEISPIVSLQHETEEFKWSIDQLSEMNPADISGDQPSYILEAQKKEYNDDSHQQTVTTYFKTRVIAPSPCVSKSPSTPLYDGEDKSCQTNISLPFNFDLESILGEECLLDKSEKSVSDASFRRMLFESETPGRDGCEVRELSEPDYIEELQSSPVIKAVNFSPLSGSDYPPSFEICTDDNNPLNGSLLSPINSNSKPFSNFRTPARLNSPAAGLHSTPAPGYLANTPGYLGNTPGYHGSTPGFHGNTPGRPRHPPHMMMSTPGPAHAYHADPDVENTEAKTPAASSKRRLSPDKNPLFKNSQFTSPFISPIPKSLSYIKRHPKCPKKSKHDTPNGSPRKRPGDGMLSPADSPGDMLSPASSLASPASSDASPEGLVVKQHMPMESSRIESGADISSDGEKEKTKMMMQHGIQPLDISEIKPQDNSQKLRTNNYLDISDKPDNACYSPSNACCNNTTCCHGNNTCQSKDDVRSKDSGFGTSSAMSTMATSTLPPLSETSNILALDSRPGKRKKYECSPVKGSQMNDSGLQPPPVKRVVIAADTTSGPTRRKHWSLD